MKGTIFLSMFVFVCSLMQLNVLLSAQEGVVGWDARYNIFYNKKRFSTGVIDEQGKTLVAVESYGYLCAWDLHGVILKYNTWSWVMCAKTVAVLRHKGFKEYLKLFGRYSTYTKKLRMKQREQGFPEAGIDGLYHFFIQDQFEDDAKLFSMTLARLRHLKAYLDKDVIAIVAELEKRGARTHIFSNMNKSEAKKLSALFLLETGATKDTESHAYFSDLLVREGNFFVSTTDFLLAKPLPDAYRLFFQKHSDWCGLRIFVDDKPENLKAAVEHGFDVGILMKTPAELVRSFEGLSLFSKTPSA